MKKKSLLLVLLAICLAMTFACKEPESEVTYEIVGAGKAIYLSTSAESCDFLAGVSVKGAEGAEIAVDSASVVFGTPGKYTVTYSYKEVGAERTVYILGTPQISFEPQKLELPYGEVTETDALLRGVRAKDTVGKEIELITVSDYGTLDMENVRFGEYEVTYAVRDRVGNIATALRKVEVVKSDKNPILAADLGKMTLGESFRRPVTLASGDEIVGIKIGEKTLPAETYSVENGEIDFRFTAFEGLAGKYDLLLSTREGYAESKIEIALNCFVGTEATGNTFLFDVGSVGGRENVIKTQIKEGNQSNKVTVNPSFYPDDLTDICYLLVDVYAEAQMGLEVKIGDSYNYLQGGGSKVRLLNADGVDLTQNDCRIPAGQWMTILVDLADYKAAAEESKVVSFGAETWDLLAYDNLRFLKSTEIIANTDIILDKSVTEHDFMQNVSNVNGYPVWVDATSVAFGTEGIYWIHYFCYNSKKTARVSVIEQIVLPGTGKETFDYTINAEVGGRENVISTQITAGNSANKVYVNPAYFPADLDEIRYLLVDVYADAEMTLTVNIGETEQYLQGNGPKVRLLNADGVDLTQNDCRIPAGLWMTILVDLADYKAATEDKKAVAFAAGTWDLLAYDNLRFLKSTEMTGINTDIILDTKLTEYDFLQNVSNVNGYPVRVDTTSVAFGTKGAYWIDYCCYNTKVTARVVIVDQIVLPDAGKETFDYTVWTGSAIGGRDNVIQTQIKAGNSDNKVSVNPSYFPADMSGITKLKIDVFAWEEMDFTANIGGTEVYLNGNSPKLRMLDSEGRDITGAGLNLPVQQWVTLVVDVSEIAAGSAEKFVRFSTNSWSYLYYDTLRFE